MTNIHRDTIMRLGVRIGQGCARALDHKMQNLSYLFCQHLQFDKVWGFIGKKQRHLSIKDDLTLGDVWTFCAIDAESKLVPARHNTIRCTPAMAARIERDFWSVGKLVERAA
jgi:hypothetical protein